jgi:hypothetical protein
VPFPNPATQFKKGVGQQLGKVPPIIGKRRLTKQRRIEALKVKPEFTGDSLALFQMVYRDETMPMELRLAAARCASAFERGTIMPKAEPEKQLVNLDALDDEDRAHLARIMPKVLPSDGGAPRQRPMIEGAVLSPYVVPKHPKASPEPAPVVDKPAHGEQVYPDAPSDTEALSREVARSQAELLLARRFGRLK